MGQIVSSAAKPKRCNLNQLSQVPTPAAGEYILVSSDNSMNAAGQGNFDCYIMGDGRTAATALPVQPIAANEVTKDNKNSVTSGAVYNAVSQINDKISTIEKVDIYDSDESIIVADDNEQEIVKITSDGLSAKSLKVGTKPVALSEDLEAKQDVLIAGDNISIDENNVISADFPYTNEAADNAEENQIWSDDDGTEDYVKIDKNGIYAKEFYYTNGHKLLATIICNTPYNQSAIASFINKYIAKEVDEFNQLTLMMCGDSIFGRQALGTGEMTPTTDVNTPGSTSIGYETGHFPPNMWVQNVPFKVLQSLQYSCADVKYFNHAASEVAKVGSWVDMYPNGADALRTVKTNTTNDSISLHFSGAKFAKVVISNYGQYSTSADVAVTISENGGSYVAPSQLGLTESHAHTNSGEYQLRDFASIKFAQLVFGGFDTSKSYDLKVTLTNSSYINVWGFETWTRERINVVVGAEGGNTAGVQLSHPLRFYNEVLKPELCIMNSPFLNDNGSTNWYTWYKGEKEPSSAAIDSPSQYDFIYCKEDGTYTNYGGVVAVEGDYIEYDGTGWVFGSTKIQNMYSTYRSRMKSLMVMLKSIGTPMLMMATHTSTGFVGKPFIKDAADFMKLILKESGFACIDVYQYQSDYNITGICSDGTHLNDAGVQMYADLISPVLSKDAEYVADGRAVVEYGCFTGHSNGGNTSFGFVTKNVPKVFLSNPSVSITSVSREGFTVSGSGEYDYFVKP